MKKTKRGRFGDDEVAFIEKNVRTMGLEQVAKQLNRTVESVKNYTLRLGIKFTEKEKLAESDIIKSKVVERLRKSVEFSHLQREFSDDEVDYFIQRYEKIMTQFKGDVWATEETSVFMLIKHEILAHRNLCMTKSVIEELNRLEGQIRRIYADYGEGSSMTDEQRRLLVDFQQQATAIRASQQSSSRELATLTEKQSSLMKDLKATREQRISKIEKSTKNFMGLLEMLSEQAYAEEIGEELEIVKVATNKELGRLSEYHDYGEDSLDRPFLTPETVKENK